MTLDAALALTNANMHDTIVLDAGEYQLAGTSITLLATTTLKAAPGAVAVITASDGAVPNITMQAGSALIGVRIAGDKTANSRMVHVSGDGCEVSDCLFTGYNSTTIFVTGNNAEIQRNTFVDCGGDPHYAHPIYVGDSNGTAADVFVSENIAINCTGWSFHSWGDDGLAERVIFRNNFTYRPVWGGIYLDGQGIVADQNIVLDTQLSAFGFSLPRAATFQMTRCLFRLGTYSYLQGSFGVLDDGQIIDGCYFDQMQDGVWGTNPHVIGDEDSVTVTGHSYNELKAAAESIADKIAASALSDVIAERTILIGATYAIS